MIATVCATAPAAAATAGDPDAQPQYPWPRRVAAATRFARQRSGAVSFAVVGERGNLRGYKPRRAFHSASVVKAMLLVAYLRRPGLRQRELSATERDLLGPMIRRSDNAAATTVYNRVGSDGLLRLARAARMHDFRPDPVWGFTLISARDQALFMFRLRRYLPSRHRRYALHLLSHIVSDQRWGIPEAKPPGWRVYFKGGWLPAADGWWVNQVARLSRGGKRLALALLTRGGPSFEYGVKTIEGVTARLLRSYNDF